MSPRGSVMKSKQDAVLVGFLWLLEVGAVVALLLFALRDNSSIRKTQVVPQSSIGGVPPQNQMLV